MNKRDRGRRRRGKERDRKEENRTTGKGKKRTTELKKRRGN